MRNLILIFSTFLLITCKEKSLHEIKEENQYYKFQKQTSPNDKYEIYSYCKFGTFAFSSDICGTILIKKGEIFSENKGYKLNGHINSWKNDTLIINRFDNSLNQPKDTIRKVSYEKYDDLNIKIFNYGSINSSGMKEYRFNNFKLNNNAICLENIERILGEDLGKSKCFPLGSFEIINTKDSLKEVIVYHTETSMDFTYHNPDGTFTKNLPEIETLELHFIPSKKTKPINTEKSKGIFIDIE